MDQNLIGYLLNALEPDEKRQLEARLRADPAARARLAALRRALAPLAADAEPPAPPPGLADRALAHVERCRPRLPDHAPVRRPGGPGAHWAARANLAAAAAIVLLVVGVGAVWLAGQWQRARREACAANLLAFWRGLEAYSDHHDGGFPRVEAQGPNGYAGSFVPRLTGAGVLPPSETSVLCPAQGRRPPDGRTPRDLQELYDRPDRCEFHRLTHELAGSYAYSLGYWQGQTLCGLRRDSDGQLPLLADRPSADGGNSPNHGGQGQNVLYVGGHVVWHTCTTVGPGGDDIFRNRDNRVLAGLDPTDAVLGPSDATASPPD
jgi:hypothetical protein